MKWGATAGMTGGILTAIGFAVTLAIYAWAFIDHGEEVSVLAHPIIILVTGCFAGSIGGLLVGGAVGAVAGTVLQKAGVADHGPLAGSVLSVLATAAIWAVAFRESDAWQTLSADHPERLVALLVAIAATTGFIAGRIFTQERHNG